MINIKLIVNKFLLGVDENQGYPIDLTPPKPKKPNPPLRGKEAHIKSKEFNQIFQNINKQLNGK